jgi:3-phenylpropionate/trans-cinnamate dioxygenase ferredoxin reductase subunit
MIAVEQRADDRVRILVVGAGQAASSLMVKLRSLGFDGEIVLIGDEPHLPYQRPPLSKKYLAGETPCERLLLRQAAWYEKNRIDVRLGVRAVAIDRCARKVRLSNGESLAYDRLALTTGARARRLPAEIGGDLAHVFLMRDLADADALRAVMAPGRRVLVIGGGYIGLEAASEATKEGLDVTLIEAADRILKRVAAPETANFFRDLHKARGVDIREGLSVVRLQPAGAGGIEAKLSDGSTLPVDLAIVGVGILPNSELAAEAGLAIELDAIKVDDRGRTVDPSIFAAGDCVAFDWKSRPVRLESVQNAQDQAAIVAANMLGQDVVYRPEPWFWSDQYDVKLQIAGLHHGYDQVIRRAGQKEGAQAHFYYEGETFLAVDAMNDPVAYKVAKRLLSLGRPLPKAAAADPGFDLKALLAA